MTVWKKQMLSDVLKRLTRYRDAELFQEPVDWHGMELHDYLDVIALPMDLRTVGENLQNGMYTDNPDLFWSHLETIWSNCELYNGHTSVYGRTAQKMRELTRKQKEQASQKDRVQPTAKVEEEPRRVKKQPPQEYTSPPAMEVPNEQQQAVYQQKQQPVVANRTPVRKESPNVSDPMRASIGAAVTARILQLNEIAVTLIMKYLCYLQSARPNDGSTSSSIIRHNTLDERAAFPQELVADQRESVRLNIGSLSIEELKGLYLLTEHLIDAGLNRVS